MGETVRPSEFVFFFMLPYTLHGASFKRGKTGRTRLGKQRCGKAVLAHSNMARDLGAMILAASRMGRNKMSLCARTSAWNASSQTPKVLCGLHSSCMTPGYVPGVDTDKSITQNLQVKSITQNLQVLVTHIWHCGTGGPRPFLLFLQ